MAHIATNMLYLATDADTGEVITLPNPVVCDECQTEGYNNRHQPEWACNHWMTLVPAGTIPTPAQRSIPCDRPGEHHSFQ